MKRINEGMAIVGGWIFIAVMLPFSPLFYVVGWLDEVLYRRKVRREVNRRMTVRTPTPHAGGTDA